MPPNLSPKTLYSEAIRQNISKRDWSKLSDVMLGAERAGVSRSLQSKGWYHVGIFEADRSNHPAAIIALNSARALAANPEKVLQKMVEQYGCFYDKSTTEFSRMDLLLLLEGLARVGNFVRVHSKSSNRTQNLILPLEARIRQRIDEAPDKLETPLTHHVERIFAALYPPMTIEEVRAEFARIIEPLIRERMSRGPAASAGGGGRGPKDPEDGNPMPQEEPPAPDPQPKGKKKKPRK